MEEWKQEAQGRKIVMMEDWGWEQGAAQPSNNPPFFCSKLGEGRAPL
jgi:hypothetical protein